MVFIQFLGFAMNFISVQMDIKLKNKFVRLDYFLIPIMAYVTIRKTWTAIVSYFYQI